MLKVLALADVSGLRFGAAAAGVGQLQAGLGAVGQSRCSAALLSARFTRTEPITMKHGIQDMIFKAP